jgi:hypothetical protein
MVVNCRTCQGVRDLSRKECFIGISEKFIPGFQGGVVLRGIKDHHYHGHIVEALSAHSSILGEIRSMGRRRGDGIRSPRSLSKLVSDIESSFIRDPRELISQGKGYRKRFASVLKKGADGELEALDSILESTSLMLRKLERELSRQGND